MAKKFTEGSSCGGKIWGYWRMETKMARIWNRMLVGGDGVRANPHDVLTVTQKKKRGKELRRQKMTESQRRK